MFWQFWEGGISFICNGMKVIFGMRCNTEHSMKVKVDASKSQTTKTNYWKGTKVLIQFSSLLGQKDETELHAITLYTGYLLSLHLYLQFNQWILKR